MTRYTYICMHAFHSHGVITQDKYCTEVVLTISVVDVVGLVSSALLCVVWCSAASG